MRIWLVGLGLLLAAATAEAATITITPNAVPSDATGRVRFDIYFDEPIPATS